jgi:hypothetical protein
MKNRNFHLTFLFPGFLLLALLAACTSETEEYIQGYWYRGNAHFMDQWYFDAGTFQHKSEVFNGSPNITSGLYRVLEFTEDSLLLELYDMGQSFGDDTHQITIQIDFDTDTIHLSRQTYSRILPY